MINIYEILPRLSIIMGYLTYFAGYCRKILMKYFVENFMEYLLWLNEILHNTASFFYETLLPNYILGSLSRLGIQFILDVLTSGRHHQKILQESNSKE